MSHLPPAAHAAIKQRFATLLDEGEQLLPRMRQEQARSQYPGTSVCVQEFESFRTRMLNLIGHLGDDRKLAVYSKELENPDSYASVMERLLGILRGLADDYEQGFLDTILRRAEAEAAADYLGQAERLLGEGQPGKYDHVPAAVLFGAVLEKALRTLCSRQSPPLPLIDARGPKTMNPLIDDLKKANVFNELKAKQPRAWADIRNAAAHGDFAKFKRSDVEAMGLGVQTFLADNL